MFERFSKEAIKVIMFAQEEARRLRHTHVGTEHILLGLIAEKNSNAAKALKICGVDLKAARQATEAVVVRDKGFVPVEIPFTANAKAALEKTWNLARQLGQNNILPDNLLIGTIDSYDCQAVKVLSNLEVSPEHVKRELAKILGLSADIFKFESPLPEAEKGARYYGKSYDAQNCTCTWCNSEIDAAAKLCQSCQRPVGEYARQCPQCSEVIWADAKICRFCQHEF